MKKLLYFLTKTEKGEKILLAICAVTGISLVIGIILSLPIFWLGGKEYEVTWMNSIAPYFFYPFIAFGAFIIFLFAPYMWYIGASGKYEGDNVWVLRGFAVFLSIVPGAIIYNNFIFKELCISSGIHNLVGMLLCGILYLILVKIILKKPFSVAQTFMPLC